MYQESKIKESELVSLNIINMNASIDNVSNARNSYNFVINMGYVRPDEDRDYFKLIHYDYDFSGVMRMFNAKIIYDSYYMPINILYILYKIASTVRAESIKITYSANAKIDKSNYDLISDYYNVEMNIKIDNDNVYHYNKDNAYNDYSHMTCTDYDSILEEIRMLRIARKLLINDDLSNISNDETIKGYIYNNIFGHIAYKIEGLLFAYRKYMYS